MLRLGQVYYWLGKQKEGQEEFDKLLAKHDRRPEMLGLLARVLRDLGAVSEARKLMEEAYDKSSDARFRQNIAHFRAITSKDTDDEILWLERCDPSDVHTKALRARLMGHRAVTQGKDAEAAASFREAVAIYEGLPQSVDVLNNGALVYLELFETTGDRSALQRGAQWLEKAVGLSPTDSVILSNAATEMLRAAAQDLAGDKLNLRELQMSGDLSALQFLVGDQKDLDALRLRARQQPELRKCISYLERNGVLAPKSLGDNYSALAIYSFLRDRESLQRLGRRIEEAQPDTQETAAAMLKYYQYKDEDSAKDRRQSRLVRARELESRLRGGDKGPAYAAAVNRLIDLELSMPDEEPCDADELVRLAEDAHRAAPSLGTYNPLIDALMYRAGKKLAADFPQYAAATRGSGRAASGSQAVALAMQRSDALGKAARENKDVQRMIAVTVQRLQAFPETRGALARSELAAAQPPQDELRAKCLVPDDTYELALEISGRLMPINPHEAFIVYWKRCAAGEASPREPLDKLVKLGVPLPVGLIQ
jgi:hypothetical protein